MKAKYIGKNFGDWLVTYFFKQNDYHKKYINDKKEMQHNAYKYVLTNTKENKKLEISGNSLRLLNNGKTTIDSILKSNSKKSKIEPLTTYVTNLHF